MQKRSSYNRKEIPVIVIAAVSGALICTLAMSWYLNRDNRWFRLISPSDETATEIVALDRGLNPYVRTQQGHLYLCTGATWRATCRQVTPEELPTTKVHPQWSSCGSTFPQTPVPPGTVVDSIEAGRCSEAATYGKVVLLNDGTLWEWSRTFSWVNQFALVTSTILGVGLGIAVEKVIAKIGRILREL